MTADTFLPLQGMSDIAAPEIHIWRMIEKRARSIFDSYGYEELRTPALENLTVFQRAMGDVTDVVKKEMYSLKPGRQEIALRPEGTAGVIRHLAGCGEQGLHARVFYIAPMFRHERPQYGRKRQFHQIGAEAAGEANPLADIECILLQCELLDKWGLKGTKIQVNTLGAKEEQGKMAEGIRRSLGKYQAELCDNCLIRFDENVLRIMDCKNELCQKIVDELPAISTYLSPESQQYLETILEKLDFMGVHAEFNNKLVRGLDYYVHTVWEIAQSSIGTHNAIAGGGRYEIALGKRSIPGVGFAVGIERVITSLAASGIAAEQFAPKGGVWLISIGGAALIENMKLARELRAHGVRCGMELSVKSIKAQMRRASRSSAEKAIIRGDKEIAEQMLVIKDMKKGTQQKTELAALLEKL